MRKSKIADPKPQSLKSLSRRRKVQQANPISHHNEGTRPVQTSPNQAEPSRAKPNQTDQNKKLQAKEEKSKKGINGSKNHRMRSLCRERERERERELFVFCVCGKDGRETITLHKVT
ncbi:hypothetical protein EYC84_005620 [Monilinia fructicola]|nr:hypothetical protein EYC84_005620 [Monilinia fructicola]